MSELIISFSARWLSCFVFHPRRSPPRQQSRHGAHQCTPSSTEWMGLLASGQMGAMPALFVRNEYIDFRMIKLRLVGTLWFGITNEMVYDSLSV